MPDNPEQMVEQNLHILPNGSLIKRHRDGKIQMGTIHYFDNRVLVLQIDSTFFLRSDENYQINGQEFEETGNYYSQAIFNVGALKTLRLRGEKNIWGLKVVQTNIKGNSKIGAFRYALRWERDFSELSEPYEYPEEAVLLGKEAHHLAEIYERLTTNTSVLLEGFDTMPEELP